MDLGPLSGSTPHVARPVIMGSTYSQCPAGEAEGSTDDLSILSSGPGPFLYRWSHSVGAILQLPAIGYEC